jgi:sterol desaturase/sphingolipid hydroxylase (fatty acid hydroxylase superfamily)
MTRILPYLWYPLFFALALLAFFMLLARGVSPAIAAYAPALAVGLSILLLEMRFTERDDWRPKQSDVMADAAFMGLVMVAFPRVLMAFAVLVLAGYMHAHFASAWWPHAWPLWAQMIAMVLAVDFVRYWLHRACHRVMPLWRLHEVHHSPDILYVMNVGRFHPAEKVLHFALDTVPFLFLGVAPEVFAGYFLLYSVNGFFQHSNIKLRYGWLNYVVGSAETHRWHHARDPKTASCNFGNTTIVWDVIFRTWHLPGPVGDIGIMNREYPRGFLAQMVTPFQRRDGRPRRSVKAWLADTLVALRLRMTSIGARRRLARTMRDPMRVQRELLARIVKANRDTTFGRQHGFDRIAGYADFAKQVPVSDFERLRPFVDAEIATGEKALTAEAPVSYMRTSGTTGAPKDVPLTPTHLEALRQVHKEAVAFQHHACPEGFEGGIVAMVSPAFEGQLANGKPYGSASGIVAGNTPAAVREKFVVPAAVLGISESRVKYLMVLRLAIARRDVTYLGAANPTTLLTLIKLYREHQAELIDDLRRGTFFLAERVPAEVMSAVRARLRADPERAGQLERLRVKGPQVRIADLWPSVRLVVTWTCASAGVAAQALRSELSKKMRIMELGYISSEFRGTITIGRRSGTGLPTFDTHFFEFAERGSWDAGSRDCLTLGEVRKGRDYYLIVTTPSGLYRYFINDVVKVTGFLHGTPLLKFVQKGKGVTNITGEKLYEAQVLQAVRESMASLGRDARFVMMLADEDARGYRLYVEPGPGVALDAGAFARAVDARLAVLNVEYQAKRESERLAPLEARWLRSDTGEGFKLHCVKQGQREGQFKMVSLDYRKKFTFDLDAHSEPA